MKPTKKLIFQASSVPYMKHFDLHHQFRVIQLHAEFHKGLPSSRGGPERIPCSFSLLEIKFTCIFSAYIFLDYQHERENFCGLACSTNQILVERMNDWVRNIKWIYFVAWRSFSNLIWWYDFAKFPKAVLSESNQLKSNCCLWFSFCHSHFSDTEVAMGTFEI